MKFSCFFEHNLYGTNFHYGYNQKNGNERARTDVEVKGIRQLVRAKSRRHQYQRAINYIINIV